MDNFNGGFMIEQEFDNLRNMIERQMESRYPGYRGPVYGVFTSPVRFTGFDDVEEPHGRRGKKVEDACPSS
jgi:hypothetical protein